MNGFYLKDQRYSGNTYGVDTGSGNFTGVVKVQFKLFRINLQNIKWAQFIFSEYICHIQGGDGAEGGGGHRGWHVLPHEGASGGISLEFLSNFFSYSFFLRQLWISAMALVLRKIQS